MSNPTTTTPTTQNAQEIVDAVRQRYGSIGAGKTSGCGCSCSGAEQAIGTGIGYSAEDLSKIPAEANLGLGCGAPLQFLALRPGETVVDLGSGGGIDAFVASGQVGPQGRVIGVDMTPEMLDRARAAATKGGYKNVEFREGRLEALPLPDASADAMTSNCVINLVPDKAVVFREMARVLRPGGRAVISDIVLDRPLPEAVAKDLLAWAGCVAGAEMRGRYFAMLREAGFGEPEVLRDVDFAAVLAETSPAEAKSLLDRFGLRVEDVIGVVRSVTYRATKPAA